MNPIQTGGPAGASIATDPALTGAPRARPGGAAQGIALMAVMSMPTLALAALVPGLPQLFRQFSSVPHFELLVPMIITVPSLCVALFSGFAGAIADRWGRRKLLLVALMAFSLLGLAPMLFDSLWLIVASRVVVGLAEAATARGFEQCFLQVEVGNAAALALYRRASFATAWCYEYWRRA